MSNDGPDIHQPCEQDPEGTMSDPAAWLDQLRAEVEAKPGARERIASDVAAMNANLAARPGRPTVDLPADLHFVDDDGFNLARLADASDPSLVSVGAILLAGTPDTWTGAEVVDVDADGWIHFRQVSARLALVTRNFRSSHIWRLNDEQHELRNASHVVNEDGQWSITFEDGLPVHGDGSTREEAVADAATALRDYAADWHARLHAAPNHTRHGHVVEWIDALSDEQITEALSP